MKRNIYRNIKDFGNTAENKNLEINNPLSYCLNWTLDQQFLHGGNSYTYGQYSKPCQAYLSDYCAEEWDGFCEVASKNKNISFPNNLDTEMDCGSYQGTVANMTAGDILIRNTAMKKYLSEMNGDCVQKFQPFDPTVVDSPMISYWQSANCGSGCGACRPKFEVNPSTIDKDPVMIKVLEKPSIAIDILGNIYETMLEKGTLQQLANTRLGNFFSYYFINPTTNPPTNVTTHKPMTTTPAPNYTSAPYVPPRYTTPIPMKPTTTMNPTPHYTTPGTTHHYTTPPGTTHHYTTPPSYIPDNYTTPGMSSTFAPLPTQVYVPSTSGIPYSY